MIGKVLIIENDQGIEELPQMFTVEVIDENVEVGSGLKRDLAVELMTGRLVFLLIEYNRSDDLDDQKQSLSSFSRIDGDTV